jgi:outer membrane protein assembly factor BamB
VKLRTAGALFGAAIAAVAASAATATGQDWPQPNGNQRGTRAVEASPISSRSVAHLRVRWRFPLTRGSTFGSFASTPLVVGTTVYVQDLSSSVYALDTRTGRLSWTRPMAAPNDGPNGVAVAGRRLFGTTDTSVFALDRHTGRRLWARRLTNRHEQFVDIAPLAARGLVFASTVGLPPGGRGALYALDQRDGRIRWRFDTIRDPWPYPSAGGGGAWYPPSLAPDGRLYVGISNPGPWGGSPVRPNGGMYPGPAPYTAGIVALTADTGGLLWYDQVTKHDVRDYDFQASPIVVGSAVFGVGKAGRVVAWDRVSGRRLWARAVGTHLNDLGPLPRRPTTVCPGLWGGVLTPMAYARGRLFLPVVERCMRESAVHPAFPADLSKGDGVLAALSAKTGRQLWTRRLGSAPTGCATVVRDVVFVPTLDGRLVALAAGDGRTLWQTHARAGINGCPSIAGGLLLVGAGAPHADGSPAVKELIAYELPGYGP